MKQNIRFGLISEFLLVGMDAHGSFSLSSNKTALFAQSLGTYLQSIAAVFNEQAIANTAWAFAKVGWDDPQLFEALAYAAVEKIGVLVVERGMRQLQLRQEFILVGRLLVPDDDHLVQAHGLLDS